MLQSIANLIKESEASQVQLNISVLGDELHVILNTKLGDMPKNASKDLIKLRQALSSPLSLKGEIGSVDVQFTDVLSQFIESYSETVVQYNNLLDVKSKHESNKKASKKQTTPTSEAVNQSSNTETVNCEEPQTTDFLDNEPESL